MDAVQSRSLPEEPGKNGSKPKRAIFPKIIYKVKVKKKTVRTTQKGCEITVLNQKSSIEMNNLPFISA